MPLVWGQSLNEKIQPVIDLMNQTEVGRVILEQIEKITQNSNVVIRINPFVAGQYTHDTKTLEIGGSIDINPHWAAAILVHELTHAIDHHQRDKLLSNPFAVTKPDNTQFERFMGTTEINAHYNMNLFMNQIAQQDSLNDPNSSYLIFYESFTYDGTLPSYDRTQWMTRGKVLEYLRSKGDPYTPWANALGTSTSWDNSTPSQYTEYGDGEWHNPSFLSPHTEYGKFSLQNQNIHQIGQVSQIFMKDSEKPLSLTHSYLPNKGSSDYSNTGSPFPLDDLISKCENFEIFKYELFKNPFNVYYYNSFMELSIGSIGFTKLVDNLCNKFGKDLQQDIEQELSQHLTKSITKTNY